MKSHWHYAIAKRTVEDEILYGIHEIYDVRGEQMWTLTPVSVEESSVDDVILTLERMLRDAKKYKVVDLDAD